MLTRPFPPAAPTTLPVATRAAQPLPPIRPLPGAGALALSVALLLCAAPGHAATGPAAAAGTALAAPVVQASTLPVAAAAKAADDNDSPSESPGVVAASLVAAVWVIRQRLR